MHDKRIKEWMVLAIADELIAYEKKALMEHLRQCDECRSEFDELQRLRATLEQAGTAAPSEELLAESRRELRRSLSEGQSARVAQTARREVSRAPERRSWTEWFPRFRLTMAGMAAVAAGVLIGFIAFGGGTSEVAETPVPILANADHELGPSGISNVRFVHVDQRDGEIEVEYELVRSVRLRAGVDDARMQRMLAYALVNERNPGVRLKAINALDVATPVAQDDDIKRALIVALKTDPNAAVRKHSLHYLYKVPFDDDIKNACLFVLINDDNPGMRVAAINMLAAAKLDGFVAGDEVYDVLKAEMKTRDDDYLRVRSGGFIQEVSDVK